MCNYYNNGAKSKGKNHKFWIKKATAEKKVLFDDDDDSDDSDERNPSSTSEKEFTEHQNLFLTCDWLYDASLASDAKKSKRRTKGERRKAAAKPSQKYFTSNVELDGPIVHFTVGPALRKKYASVFSLSASDDEDPKGYKKTVSDGKRLVRFSLRDE